MGSSIRARPPRGLADPVQLVRDPDVLAAVLEDAAHFPGGHAAALAHPRSEAGVAAIVSAAATVLPIGAQSSVTGGATPMGEVVLGTGRLNRILEIGRDFARVEPGVTLLQLDVALRERGAHYPPAPTFAGACIGGTVATNAAGAATFKYGTTRDWVQALTVVLTTGDVLDIRRGETRASAAGHFEIELVNGNVSVPVPSYRLPAVPKVSAGYFAGDGMDLIDLFIGSEGTLGIVTEITLRMAPERPPACLVFVPFGERNAALSWIRQLRAISQNTWRTGDPHGVDVAAIEHFDQRSLQLLRDDGADRLNGVSWPDGTEIALLITLELSGVSAEDAYEQIGRAGDSAAPDSAIARFCRLLQEAGVLDAVAIAIPGDQRRADQLAALREAVPAGVNRRVGLAKRTIDPRIEKTAGDMIVPVDQIERIFDLYQEEFARRHLDAAIWGHISDGNVHPNVIPRSFEDVREGKAAMIALGREVIRLGGSPLAEHGVGRNEVKQQLLRELYGADGIEAMRRVKRALDPEWKLSPGVLFHR